MNKIAVYNLCHESKFFKNRLRVAVKKALQVLKQENVSLDIYLIGDLKMSFLNKIFRKRNRPTDVLSFKEKNTFPHPETKNTYLGEIYLDTHFIKKKTLLNLKAVPKQRAVAYAWVNYQLLAIRMAIHGLLHLLNYNHQKKDDRIRMEKQEQLLIFQL